MGDTEACSMEPHERPSDLPKGDCLSWVHLLVLTDFINPISFKLLIWSHMFPRDKWYSRIPYILLVGT